MPNKNLTQGMLLTRMTNRIRQSLELQEILSATVEEMRTFLGTDRVKVYRFEEDGSGEVIAESVIKDRLPSLLGLHFPAMDIPPASREMFIKARTRSIINVAREEITLSRLRNPRSTGDLTIEEVLTSPLKDLLTRPVDPCHLQYLRNMGVLSSLVVPILYGKKLWGLIASHHAEPRNFSYRELQVVQMIADQVSVAISQSTLLHQTRVKVDQEAIVNQIATWLHAPLNIPDIMQAVLNKVVKAVNGSGGQLYFMSQEPSSPSSFYTYGNLPKGNNGQDLTLEENHIFWQEILDIITSETSLEIIQQVKDLEKDISLFDSSSELLMTDLPLSWHENRFLFSGNKLHIISDIYQAEKYHSLQKYFEKTALRGILIFPLKYRQHLLGFLNIFRDEIDTDITWAGRFNNDERHQQVRESFAAWREVKKGQINPWTKAEIELVIGTGTHLAMSVMQNLLYHWEREQRLLVELRNQELNSARSIAEEASRLKSEFISSTSHELRTPLSATLNYLKIIKEEFYDDKEELKEYINVAYNSAEKLVEILNDVLDLAKIEAGRMSVNFEIVDLGFFLEEKGKLFRLESVKKNITFTIECEVESVWADELKLGQVLTNLLSNAFKFTSEGEIKIKVKPYNNELNKKMSKDMIKIAVSDTGIGVEPEKKGKLFEAFVQADGSIKRRYGGTGLGLAICKRLVEIMGGEIWMDSCGKGQGTTVSFILPHRPEDSPSPDKNSIP
jgi:light-regulated signal transduction histidine kinase (bacteriophytochrome)